MVWGVGCGFCGLGFVVWGVGCGVGGSGFGVWGLRLRVWCLVFGFGFWGLGSGFCVLCFGMCVLCFVLCVLCFEFLCLGLGVLGVSGLWSKPDHTVLCEPPESCTVRTTGVS